MSYNDTINTGNYIQEVVKDNGLDIFNAGIVIAIVVFIILRILKWKKWIA